MKTHNKTAKQRRRTVEFVQPFKEPTTPRQAITREQFEALKPKDQAKHVRNGGLVKD